MKTFTVCQYDDGPLIDLGKAVQFLAARKEEGRDVPMMCYPHEIPPEKPSKRWLASFTGRLRTHPVRSAMQQLLRKRSDVSILDVPYLSKSSAFFVNRMLQSYIALCPRGYGSTSFRFYEAMQLGVVPLLISDIDNRPFKAFLDWDQTSLYAESVGDIESVLSSRTTAELLQMGEAARTMWYHELAFGKWCKYVLKELEGL